MEKIVLQLSLSGVATAAERIAKAFLAMSESLRATEDEETEDVPVRLPSSVATADEEPERVFVDPTQIFGSHAPVPTPAPPAEIQAAIPAPPAPVVGFAVALAVGELDVAGHVWDERIHSGTRAKNKDGTWRTKRGVSAGVVAQVEAEMKAGKPAAVAPGVPVPPPPVASPETGLKFNDVVKRVQAGISAGTFTQADLTAQCKTLGLGSFPELAKRPDLFASLLANLGL